MVKMINSFTGTEMLVSEERVDEYLAAGHKLAAKEHAQKEAKPEKKPKAKAKAKAKTKTKAKK